MNLEELPAEVVAQFKALQTAWHCGQIGLVPFVTPRGAIVYAIGAARSKPGGMMEFEPFAALVGPHKLDGAQVATAADIKAAAGM